MTGWGAFTWPSAAPSEPGTWDKPHFRSDSPGGSPGGGTPGTSVCPWALVSNLKRQALLTAVRSRALQFPGLLKVQETSDSCPEAPSTITSTEARRQPRCSKEGPWGDCHDNADGCQAAVRVNRCPGHWERVLPHFQVRVPPTPQDSLRKCPQGSVTLSSP